MYHENRNLIHQIIFVLCILFSLISPPYNQGVAWGKETKTTSGSVATWVVSTVSHNWKIDKKKTVVKCWVECKINTLTGIGIRQEIAISLVENCKALAEDPRKCVIAWASIVTSESSGWWNCRKNNKYNCFWIMQNNNYKSYNDATLHFAWKFQKWWRNAKSASFFYPSRWQKSPSRFCVSEHSSNSVIWCPNGQKNAQIIWDKLEKKF